MENKGFTIIELIVVIAIIAVLASVVLVNVISFNNKGKDSAIKGNLNTIAKASTDYYSTTGSYSGYCASTAVVSINSSLNLVTNLSLANCSVKSDSASFCYCAQLKTSSNTICVDSSGYRKETVTACSVRCGTSGICSD